MGRLFTGLIFATGAGLGIGAGLLLGSPRRPVRRTAHGAALLKLEPVLDRLERLEAFVDASERHLSQPGVAEIEKRAAATLDLVKNSFEKVRRELPELIEATIKARVAELEARLPVYSGNTAVERLIAERIGPIEKVLIDQASLMSSLRVRSEETDVNLQRLIVSIDRLCEVAPVARAQAPEMPRATKEPEPEPRKPRVPMARIFGTLLAFGLSRFLP
ncbi:MAG: hypothetical protein ABUS51_02945 [Acidobacteriota bacterium]